MLCYVCIADPLENLLDLMKYLAGVHHVGLHPDSLVKEAAQGHADNVRRILSEHPSEVA